MEEVNLKSVRDIIILSFSASELGIEFETNRVFGKGFSEADIEEAERIILTGPTLTLKTIQIMSDVNYVTPEMAIINPWIYYIEPVGLILFIDRERFSTTYLFEEDLVADVNNMRNIEFQLDYLDKNSQSDVYGNDI